jgi:glycosyltransferase involved in cell wall biosynthesis
MPKLLIVLPHPFYPDAVGGTEHSTLYMMKDLRRRGWQIELVCPQGDDSRKHASPEAQIWVDRRDGSYVAHRCLDGRDREANLTRALLARLEDFAPDIVMGTPTYDLVESYLGLSMELGFRTYLFSRTLDPFPPGFRLPPALRLIANSPVNAENLERASAPGVRVPVLAPMVDPELTVAAQRTRKFVTFINPIPEKGLTVGVEVARAMPHQPFLFVKGGWSIYLGRDFLAEVNLPPNVEVWETQSDMRKVYACTNILLFPSQWEETAGRVVTEAQMNGIPVVASVTGGVPYQVGRGGVLVQPKTDPQAFVRALQDLLGDEIRYKELAKLAVANTQRPELNGEMQMDKFVRICEGDLEQRQVALRS